MVAHSVYRSHVFLGRGVNHIAAGAHAKGIYPAPVLGVCRQFVVGGREAKFRAQFSVIFAVHIGVDQSLRMLNPYAHGKCLLLHRYFLFI